MEHALRYVWALRDEATCWRIAHLWHLKLSAEERTLAAITALLWLEPEQAIETAQFVLNAMSRGQRGPPLISYKDEARFWAENTHPDELAQYLVAYFWEMPKPNQIEFRDYVNRAVAERVA